MSKYQIVKQVQTFKWILPIFLMFNCIFGGNVNKTAPSSKPVKSNRTIQKPTISDLEVLRERLAEMMETTPQNRQLNKGASNTLSQSLSRLKDNPINVVYQMKKAEFKSKFNVSWNKNNETPVFIKGPELSEFSRQFSETSSAQEIAKEFISTHKEVFQLENSYAELETVKEFNDRYGKTHVKFQQVFEDIPIWGQTIVAHFNEENELYLINARFSPSPVELDITQINHSKDQAVQIALDDINTFTAVTEFNDEMKTLLSYDSPVGKQYIWIDEDGHIPHLIWHVQIRPNAVDNWYYFIDAKTGEILERYNNTQTDGPAEGTAIDLNDEEQTIHSYEIGGWYYMIDSSRPIWQGGSLPGTPLGGLWTLRYQDESLYYVYSNNANTWETDQVSAHSNTGFVFQYFYDTFGREAIDGDGSTIISVVNVTSGGQAMDNAYWNGAYMAYGDGNSYFTPLAGALDVAAHEMTHGIVERTVTLEYKFQSGALNESFADVFGAMIDIENWTIGEMIIPNTDYYSSGALRDLSDPNQGGANYNDPGWQPAHWDEFLDWDITYDNGGVHYNSGIPNKACYLIAEEIGREKTEQIYYRILEAEYLNSQATFVDMRLAAIQSAKEIASEMYPNDSTVIVESVMNAFDAVGIVGEEGSEVPEDLDPVQGEEWIAVINDENGDHSLLRVNPEDESVKNTITTTQVFTGTGNPITINAVGTRILFVSEGNDIIGIYPNGEGELNITLLAGLPGIWHSIALSPDDTKFAATTIGQDSTIYIFDLVNFGAPTAFHLYSPTTVEGVNSEVVIYADALDFDPSSTYLLYDAFNKIPQNEGPALEYWDVAILDVGNEIIFPVFGALPTGISMGNPSYAQTNGNYIVLDYINQNSETVWMMGVDLFEGASNWIEYVGSSSGYPRYSPDDSYLIFQKMEGEVATLRKVALADKITPSGNSELFTENRLLPSWFVIEGEMSIEENSQYPEIFSLNQNHPNPFNPVTRIDFEISVDTHVKISIFDVSGRDIKVLEDKRLYSGRHSVRWDGTNHFGKTVSAGIYLFRLQTDQFSETRKMIYLK